MSTPEKSSGSHERSKDRTDDAAQGMRPWLNLDDERLYARVGRFLLPWAWSYSDTRPGHRDPEKRERIRAIAAEVITSPPEDVSAWAFRITVLKSGERPFDIDNVPKLILDAFCERQIRKDKSSYAPLALYPDDTIDYVTELQIRGERTADTDETEVEVFGRYAI